MPQCRIGKHLAATKLLATGPGLRPPEKRGTSLHSILESLGASDEYFRKNHGRDFRQPRQRHARQRRRGSRRERAAAAGRAPSAAPAAPTGSVDVAAIVDKAAAAKGEKLAWRTSIVDLMKALDIDSSLTARKELAKELGYTGDTNDSATMNIWLHKQVMAKLAANGGKLPPDIKH